MSAIFGIVNLNGQPLNQERLMQMQSAMKYWGPDGSYLWLDDIAGFGQLQLFNTPESINEKFPLTDTDRGLVFFSSSRLDNRSELCKLLDIPDEKKIFITDAELIFDAYRKWKNDCVQYLLGDWCFAVWNKIEKKLFLARDHYGISGLYYYHEKDSFVFSSSLKGILTLTAVPKEVNELKLAQILVSWPGDGIQTCYNDILRLPPAHHLTLSAGKIEKTKYWSLKKSEELKFKTEIEYIEAFNEIFSEAVNCRLRSNKKIGSTLSAGLDSSSVSVVAANILKSRGIRLPVFTSVPVQESDRLIKSKRITDEGTLASKIVLHNGNMEHYLLQSEDISVLNGIKKTLWIHDQPVHAAGNSYWIIDVMKTARNIGCGTLLTGQCGNATISWPTPNYFSWYTSPKKPVINFQNLAYWRLFKRNILKPALPEYIINFIKNLKNGASPWKKYSAINLHFARELQLLEQMKKTGFDPTFSKINDAMHSRFQIIKPGETIVGQSWLETGAAFGIEVRDPTMDKRILEFCISVPDSVYISDGKDRMLIRRAMQGLLPDEVLWNTRRGLQAADLHYRIGADLQSWQKLVNSFSGSDFINGIIDCDKIKRCLDNLSNNQSYNEFVSIVTRGCMAGMWLYENNFSK